tara:strand:- start:242 stop:1141 length:900 start_codon:yes stop_codon:yes gene_type:complete
MSLKISHAWYSPDWEYDENNIGELRADHQVVTVEQFSEEMEGRIFCPLCFTNLSKTPKEAVFFSNGRSSHFRHWPSFQHIECLNRSIKASGFSFENEDEAKRAIDNGQMTIIHAFLHSKPEEVEPNLAPYDQTAVEDSEGPMTRLPISRYRGETFSLPSRIKTVRGICRRFDENIEKYFTLPGRRNPERLREILKNVRNIQDVNEVPSLYFGRIESVYAHGGASGTRMIGLEFTGRGYADFYFKQSNSSSEDHGVREDSVGRYLLMYGPIRISGVGLCIEHVGWGEFSLLPQQYEYLLP